VIKPANNTPLSAFALLTLAKQAGVPDGVLNAVAGNTHEISDAIMASQTCVKSPLPARPPSAKRWCVTLPKP
jgi:acyl-CoA reductase-like NAD-dependent aldehyde dehydrogenase